MIEIMMCVVLAQVDEALDVLAAVKPGDAATYREARERVLAFGSAALVEHGAADRWTADGWVRALAAEACRVRLAEPGLAAAVDHPRGLDPAVYGRFRRPEPACAAELTRRGTNAVPLLLERWRWTLSADELGEQEREVLRLAILHVPGQLGDARARCFLAEVLRMDGAPVSWRRQAAVSLGMGGGGEGLAVLTGVLDGRAPALVREACARALGRVADREALIAIRRRLESGEEDPQVWRSLVTALGLLGSEWGWEARGTAHSPEAQETRKGCAEALVAALRRRPEESQTTACALGLVSWPEIVPQVEALASDAAATPAQREGARVVLAVLRGLRRARD
ncbi:MAG: hypothetical protein HYY16_16980 [Planctomycetes bacterium]|nr:hypothetical protein [Planctomycetota bacterium]